MKFPAVSLTTKLNLLLAVAAGVAFLVSCVTFVANDIRLLRSAKETHLLSLADALGTASFDALSQGEVDHARELLSSLTSQPTVAFGGIYDQSGNLLTKYQQPHEADRSVMLPAERGHYYLPSGNLAVTSHVAKNGRHLGTLTLHANFDDFWGGLNHYIRIVALISIASLSSSVLLSSRLQRFVSVPIVGLTETAQRISTLGDYSIRVHKTSNDELGALYDEFNAMLDKVVAGERELQSAHASLESRVQRRTAELSQANQELSREITERQRAEHELAELHQKLVDAAHRAGMAEIAMDVLHNVGNVLNSVNVSCLYVSEQLQNSSVPELRRVADLLDAERQRLGEFLTSDPRGRQVPSFLMILANQLNTERDTLLREIDSLTKNVDHIKSIVAMQQSYAGVSGVVEPVELANLLDDAVRLNDSWLQKYSVEVIRQYAPLPLILAQKQKLLQVFVNLVQNARDALVAASPAEPRLILRVTCVEDDLAAIEVIDNGIGIHPEHMTKIFSHGFTTKETGHGFGLHSCANAAREMGGSLTAQSAGPGCGATFSLTLPLRPVEVMA